MLKFVDAMREFFEDWKEYGFRIAFGNLMICFLKWYLKAKRIQVTYNAAHGKL